MNQSPLDPNRSCRLFSATHPDSHNTQSRKSMNPKRDHQNNREETSAAVNSAVKGEEKQKKPKHSKLPKFTSEGEGSSKISDRKYAK